MNGTLPKRCSIEKQQHRSGLQPSNGLQDEIAIQREIILKLKSIADETAELDDMLRAIRALGSASTQLAYLLKAQHSLATGEDEEMERTLSQAIKEIMEEMKGKNS